MTATVLVGVLLGVAAAATAAHLAGLTVHRRPEHPGRLLLVLTVLAVAFSGVATARHGLPVTASALLALIPASAAAAVDAHERRLPDPLTAALAVVVAVDVAVLLVLGVASGFRGAWVFVGGAMLCLLAKALLPNAVGWGDVKLVPSLSALLAIHGWLALYAGLLAWCVLVLASAALDLVRHSAVGIVAYGPALAAGTAYGIAS